jgi:hypothetical protein
MYQGEGLRGYCFHDFHSILGFLFCREQLAAVEIGNG